MQYFYGILNNFVKRKFHINLLPGSNVVSADNIAATVKAWDKQSYSFASINVLESEGSRGSSAKNH